MMTYRFTIETIVSRIAELDDEKEFKGFEIVVVTLGAALIERLEEIQKDLEGILDHMPPAKI